METLSGEQKRSKMSQVSEYVWYISVNKHEVKWRKDIAVGKLRSYEK